MSTPRSSGSGASSGTSSGSVLLAHLFSPAQDFSTQPWQPFRPGVDIVRLYGDGEHGPSAALLRYAAGASVPAHEHTGYEHIIVLSGAQRDQSATYAAGSCAIHAPGSTHAVHSDDGCVVLAIWESPVRFL
jgi:anti-sigma factor ChrR (cupin superfamily)